MERRDTVHAAVLRRWLEREILTPLADRILPINTTIARRCANLHVPDPRPERDTLIAATALTHGLTVVTRNLADFEPIGVTVLNPWLGPGP
jgi:predicted nucleic acid-binding protein